MAVRGSWRALPRTCARRSSSLRRRIVPAAICVTGSDAGPESYAPSPRTRSLGAQIARSRRSSRPRWKGQRRWPAPVLRSLADSDAGVLFSVAVSRCPPGDNAGRLRVLETVGSQEEWDRQGALHELDRAGEVASYSFERQKVEASAGNNNGLSTAGSAIKWWMAGTRGCGTGGGGKAGPAVSGRGYCRRKATR